MNQKQQEFDIALHKIDAIINTLKEFMDGHKKLLSNHDIQKFNVFRDLILSVRESFDRKMTYCDEEDKLRSDIEGLLGSGYDRDQIQTIVNSVCKETL